MMASWRISGILAGALALSFQWAASRIDPSVPFPPVSLAERIIRLTPGDVATFFIDRLGHAATKLLIAGAIGVFLVLVAFLPEMTASGRHARPLLAGLVLAVGSMAAGFSDPVPARPLATVLASLLAGVLYGVPLAWLLGESSDVSAGEPYPSRRRALAWIGTSAAGLVLGGTVLGRLAERLMEPNTEVAIRAPDQPAPSPIRPAFPTVPGISPEITSAPAHYVVDIDLIDPVVEVAGWTLSVHGLVDRPLKLTFVELQQRFRLVEVLRLQGLLGEAGWSDVATVRTESRIDMGGRPQAGKPTWIAGVAWAGTRGISRVEVSIDGGRTWAEAMNHRPLSPLAWTQWAYIWTPRHPGTYVIMCRAVDGQGGVQDETERPPHPSGASGFHEIVLTVD